MKRRNYSCQSAFTIMESLAVILIIVLLASIVIPGLLGRTKEDPESTKVKPPAEATGEPKSGAGQASGTATAAGEESPLPKPEPAGAAR